MTTALKAKANKLNSEGGFGGQRGDFDKLLDTITTIKDFQIVSGDFGEYITFKTEEPETYYSTGGGVVVRKFKELKDDIEDIRTEGLPVRFVERISKNKRTYKDVIFYPDDDEEDFEEEEEK